MASNRSAKSLADQLLEVFGDQDGGGRVGLDDALIVRVDDQHGLGGELKQYPVAPFRPSDSGVFALHRLLRLGESLLQRGHGAQVTPDGHQSTVSAVSDHRMPDRHIGALITGIVDLPPSRRFAHGRLANQLFDLPSAIRRYGIHPGAPDPVSVCFLGQGRLANATSRTIPLLSTTRVMSEDVVIKAAGGLRIDRGETFGWLRESGQRVLGVGGLDHKRRAPIRHRWLTPLL